MNPELTKALEELKQVQAARSKNWPDYAAPTDADLETTHLARIAELKGEIETLTK